MPWLIIPYRLFIIHFSCHSFQRLLRSPAAGNRDYSTGAVANVGTNGNYWSSSSFKAGSFYAGCLNFNSGSVGPVKEGSRSIGRSVRCVQASAAAFLSK